MYKSIDVNKYEKEELMKLKNIDSAVFLLDQKGDIEEFISRDSIYNKSNFYSDYVNMCEMQLEIVQLHQRRTKRFFRI